MNNSSSNFEKNLKHDLKSLLMQIEGGLKLIEKSDSEDEIKEIHGELIQSFESFLERQRKES